MAPSLIFLSFLVFSSPFPTIFSSQRFFPPIVFPPTIFSSRGRRRGFSSPRPTQKEEGPAEAPRASRCPHSSDVDTISLILILKRRFQLYAYVKVKNWVDGVEKESVDGLSARFGAVLPSNINEALRLPAVMANPPHSCAESTSKSALRGDNKK
ncbi:hypothetical protein H6P81_017577 [Aristolochia fimbriata]|uniref:Uncharacterized protein n=1 Tax=Aristolochia fimbriata TaxID=158543 RepID=A0AAV7E2V2_ARIFI|nr:hypothetical protein H6P81_017577 [Aristolochia fimbriata]